MFKRGDLIFDRHLHGYMVLIQLSQDYDCIAHLCCRLQPKYGYSEYLQWQNLRVFFIFIAAQK